MQTLAVAHHRNHHQYYGRNRGHSPAKLDSLRSPHSRDCRGTSCRAFLSGAGLLSTPLKSVSTPASRNVFSSRTPSPTVNKIQRCSNSNAKSTTSPISIKIDFANKEEKFHFSESWAGPAYSNSPPPSSLPLPMFALKPKRTVSLDLPTLASEIDLHPTAKSAPASPTGGCSPMPVDLFDSTDSATKTLRRILNLDIHDE